MLSHGGQRGLEAKIFGLGLVTPCLGLVLVLMHSHEGCPRGLVVSRQNHVIYVTFFSDTLLEELVFLKCHDRYSASALVDTGCDFLAILALAIVNFMSSRKRS